MKSVAGGRQQVVTLKIHPKRWCSARCVAAAGGMRERTSIDRSGRNGGRR